VLNIRQSADALLGLAVFQMAEFERAQQYLRAAVITWRGRC
jgi:hypothetical protein